MQNGWGTIDRAVLIAAPVAMAILGVVHPNVRSDPVAVLSGRLGLWLGVHVTLLVLLIFLAVAVWRLTAGLSGQAVNISRGALPVFLVFYGAFDSLVGMSTGIYVRQAAQFPGAGEAVRAFWIGRFGDPWVGAIVLPGIIAWAIAVIAAAVALAQNGASRWAALALVASAILFGIDHTLPFGPLGMLAFLVGVVILLRQRSPGSRGMTADGKDSSYDPPWLSTLKRNSSLLGFHHRRSRGPGIEKRPPILYMWHQGNALA